MLLCSPCGSVLQPCKAGPLRSRQHNIGAPTLTACTRHDRSHGITISSPMPDQPILSNPRSSGSLIQSIAAHGNKCKRNAGYQKCYGATSAVLASSAGSTSHELLFVLTTLYSIAVLLLVGFVVCAFKSNEHRQIAYTRLHLRLPYRFQLLKWYHKRQSCVSSTKHASRAGIIVGISLRRIEAVRNASWMHFC